jgi:hypothetical protein
VIEKPIVAYPHSIHRAHEIISKLSDAYDHLLFLYNMETEGDIDTHDMKLFKLTPAEARVLAELQKKPVVRSSRLVHVIATIRGESEAENPLNVSRVLILRLRKKIVPYGAAIIAHHGHGYALTGIEVARENCKNGKVVGDYVPDFNPGARKSCVSWEDIELILKREPANVSEIRERLVKDWRANVANKERAINAILKNALAENRVNVTRDKSGGRIRNVWYICNKE